MADLSDFYQEDDDGYVGYVPSTVDLGGRLIGWAFSAFLIGYFFILPSLVIWNRRRQARFKGNNDTFYLDNDSDEDSPKQRIPGDAGGDTKDSDADVQSASSSQKSVVTSVIGGAVEAILDRHHVPKTKVGRRRRRMIEREKKKSKWSATSQSGQDMDVTALTLLQGIYPNGYTGSVQLGDSSREEEDDDFVSAAEDPPNTEKHSPPTAPAKLRYAEDYNSLCYLDKLALIAAWDVEMKRIIRLSTPYCTQALITGLTNIMNLAVIGKLIGTREVSAFVIVNLLVKLTSEFVGGLHESLYVLCSQAIGSGNKKLAGEYVQIVVVIYTLSTLPFMLIWAVYMGSALEWLGFDEETVEIGRKYNYILVFDRLIDGVGESVHGLLDVGGLERYSTLIGATEEILASIVLLFAGLFGSPDLIAVGLIQFGLGVLFLSMNICIIYKKGWFKPYSEGLIKTCALKNRKAVWLVFQTAMSLSFGMLLTDGEWEILTIFASFLGPAEVAAWGILDTIWSTSHELVDAIADASEVRCAYLLGAGDPNRAKVSAYKSIFLGIFTGLYVTAIVYIFGDDLPTWLTHDPALQKLLRDLLPLFGLGNLVMSLDTMNWTLLGSQGRYRLATIIVCLCSWLVTIPLSVLFSVHLNVNLQGQMTGFIIGYIVMGVTHSYYLLCSDWEKLSISVQEEHEAAMLIDQAPVSTTIPQSPEASSPPSMASGAQGPLMLPIEVVS